jgi:hypothetical protein
MTDRLTMSWRGRSYEVVRKNAGDSGEPGAVWQVMHDGALLTSFPAEDGDAAGEVEEKATGWLEGNHSRPSADVGRQ